MKPDPTRYQTLLDLTIPRTLKQLNRIIGLFAYYAKWIPNCTALTLPLTQDRDLTTDSQFSLSIKAIEAIDKLKKLLVSASLAAPILDTPLVIETDASANALGGSLTFFYPFSHDRLINVN